MTDRKTHYEKQQQKTLTQKEKNNLFKRLIRYLFGSKWMLLAALIVMLVSNLLALAAPKLSGWVINALTGDFGGKLIYQPLMSALQNAFGNVTVGYVAYYCILLAVFYLTSTGLSYLLAVIMVFLSQRITSSMRKDVFNHLMTLPVSYFDKNQTGDIISRISYDIDTINMSLTHDLLQVCTSIVTVFGSLIMMISISPLLILVFAVTVPMAILFTRRKTKKVHPLFRKRSAKLGELNGYAEEMLSGLKTIRTYGKEKEISDTFSQKNTEAVDAYYDSEYQAVAVGPCVNLVNNLSISLVTMLGGLFYMLTCTRGPENLLPIFVIALGDVSAFVQYSRKFSGPINEFANILNELQSALAAAERVFRLLDEPSEPSDTETACVLSDVQGGFSFDHVFFDYNPEKKVLKDFSLIAKPGTVNAIVGPTGAGKTTVINLLMRFYEPQKGTISVDGHPLNQITRSSLREAFTMVLQDTWLFGGTIYENIAYGKENATPEEVRQAAISAGIDPLIQTLPDGYDTILSDDACQLSKGEKQMMTIARAILSDSPILILDEATSNVDSRTEQKIQKAMVHLMENRTCLVIAHRLSTIQNADCIFVVQKGEIMESGTHDSLLAADGVYAHLYNAQFTK